LYPDYYLIVTNPIDLKIIATRIHNHEYSTLDDMESDLFLMIANAKRYNDPKSQSIFLNKKKLNFPKKKHHSNFSGCRCIEENDRNCS